MASLSEKQAQLFLDRNIGAAATIREDGTPHVTPVWVDYDGDHVVFNTAAPRAKWKHLRRDPRVTIEVHSCEDPYKYVTVTGTAELDEDEERANRHIDKLSLKYRGIPRYQNYKPGERRVIVRVTPERVFPK
ncbi:MAG TPA: PPOX class F420-dependent oxidoreductase [Gaiellaceae bacterium]|nr:PPOX class F420-dependent oxidoreductase [Gaiellaceae bacterium]